MVTLALEGTWEEIQRHSDQLAGRHVRLLVLDDEKNGIGPNDEMLVTLEKVKARVLSIPYSDSTRTQDYLREGRDGGLFRE